MILLPHGRVKNDFRKPRASGDDPGVLTEILDVKT